MIQSSINLRGLYMQSAQKATLIGLVAVVLWSALVGLIRSVSEIFGATGGAALIYSFASVLLLLTVGWIKLKEFPKQYLYWGSFLFVAYEICLSLSIGYAKSPEQAIEVGMVNYLWPALTMMFAIFFNQQKSSWLIMPGFILAMLGVCWVIGGEQGLDISSILKNMQDNPLSYVLALIGAILWSIYCTITPRFAKGQNAVTLFFILTAMTLWLKYILGAHATLHVDIEGLIYVGLAGAAMAFGYAAWNIGILKGHVTILAGASYFIPIFSAGLAAFMLNTTLSIQFWQGAVMVCVGSILCWRATR